MAQPYPLMQRYLSGLPQHEQAYPQCTIKAGLVNMSRQRAGFEAEPDMPQWLQTFICTRWAPSEWVSIVQCNAWVLAMVDKRWDGSVEQYLRFNYNVNQDFAQSPMFKLLYRLISPSFLMRHVPLAFTRAIHGPSFTITRSEPGLAVLDMAFPRGLYDQIIAQGWAAALRAMLEAAGADEPKIVMAQHTNMRAVYEATWKA